MTDLRELLRQAADAPPFPPADGLEGALRRAKQLRERRRIGVVAGAVTAAAGVVALLLGSSTGLLSSEHVRTVPGGQPVLPATPVEPGAPAVSPDAIGAIGGHSSQPAGVATRSPGHPPPGAVGATVHGSGPSRAPGDRVLSQRYTTSEVAYTPTPGGYGNSCSGQCLYATFGPNEHTVRIEMIDDSGVPVYGYIGGQANAIRYFCGSTVYDEATVGHSFRVEAVVVASPTACAEPTTGTMVVTFSS